MVRPMMTLIFQNCCFKICHSYCHHGKHQQWGHLHHYVPSKNELARIVQESCMQDLLGMCTRYVHFLARFLHNLASNGACKILQGCCKNNYLQVCTFFCKILQELVQNCARIGARLCKNRARKWTYHVHVPSKSCMLDSCTILHDLASSVHYVHT